MPKGKADVIKLSDDDLKGQSFKTAPAGKYTVKFSKKSKIKAGSNGNILNVMATISKGEHKGVNFFDNIAAHVGWKIAQILRALGLSDKQIKKLKKLTLQDVLKMITAHGKDVRAVLKTEIYQGRKQNKVVQWLPLAASEDEEDDDLEDDDEADESDEDGDDTDDEDGDDDDSDDDEDDDADEDDDDDADDDDDDSDDDDDDDSDDDDDDDIDDDDDDDDSGDDEDEDDDDDDDDEPAPKRRTAAKKTAKKPAKGKGKGKKK